MVLGEEKGVECEVSVDGMRLEHVSEFKYFGCVLDESSTDEAEYRRKVASGMGIAGVLRSLISAKGLQLECARVVHKSLLVPVLMYGSEALIWNKKEKSRIGVVQMDNLKGLLVIRKRGLKGISRKETGNSPRGGNRRVIDYTTRGITQRPSIAKG